ncbi:MAG: hypothetical protein ACYDHW_02370, partial [Syntrophorhabdaceae bacterium]
INATPGEESETKKSKQGDEQIMVPPFDLPEKDIIQMKEKAQRLKPLIERDRELARMKIREIDEVPGTVPRFKVAYGYGSVINLPYPFTDEDVAIGARDKFTIEIKGNSLVIFPVKEFKSTNVIIFEKTDEAIVSHHYLLTEDAASGEADFTVNVKRREAGDLKDSTDAMIRVITTARLPEKGSAEDILLNERSPSLTKLNEYPFIRMMSLVKPELYVFMIAGKFMPVTDTEFWLDLGNGASIIASRTRELTVRRIIDGKTFTDKN